MVSIKLVLVMCVGVWECLTGVAVYVKVWRAVVSGGCRERTRPPIIIVCNVVIGEDVSQLCTVCVVV